MGTRNLTIVRSEGKVKVAQYGQWDGYPKGQGDTIAKFLRREDLDLEKFKALLNALKEIDENIVEAFLKSIGSENGWLNSEQADTFHQKFPSINRDHGAEILNLIYDGKVAEVRLSEDFEQDKLFCEYCYKIDLDDRTVEMNGTKYTFEDWISEGFMEKLEKLEDEEDNEK